MSCQFLFMLREVHIIEFTTKEQDVNLFQCKKVRKC